MSRPVIAFHHALDEMDRFFPREDREALAAVAELRCLGSNDPAVILPRLADVDILSGAWGMPRLDAALLAAAPRLKAVCYAAGSVKYFVTPECFRRGVIVTTAMYANAVPVAEVTTALITLANKHWFACQDRLRAAAQADQTMVEVWRDLVDDGHPGNYRTPVGLVGLGAIGALVLDRLLAMDLEVLVYDPYCDPARLPAGPVRLVDDLVEMAAAVQVLSLHAPDIDACRHMINAQVLAALPDGATLINTARGRLVDEAALIAELQRGRIFAMLDVTHPEPPAQDSPLYRLPNCWLSPHRAGSSAGEIRRMGSWALAEIQRLLRGEPVRHQVTEGMLATMA